MMKIRKAGRLAVMTFALLAMTTDAKAQFSINTVTYQGVLTDNGVPVADGLYTLTFTVYDAATEGNVLETINVPGVQTAQGRFTAPVPITLTTFSGMDRWWSITFEGAELLPRQRVTAVPYAAQAINLVKHAGVGNFFRGRNLSFNFVDAQDPQAAQDGQWSIQSCAFRDGYFGVLRQTSLGPSDPYLAAVISPSGRVGIGTKDPEAKLDVNGTVRSHAITITDSSGGATISPSAYGLHASSNFFAQGHMYSSGATVSKTTVSPIDPDAALMAVVPPGTLPPWVFGLYTNGRFAAEGTKSFIIDHPLRPADEFLMHYCTEGPEPMNVYSGTVYASTGGFARVALPDYFEAINVDYRYTLTPIGAPAPNLYIASEIADGSFVIGGASAGQKISWSVSARRNDAWIRANSAPTVVKKSPASQGKYLNPSMYGAHASAGIFKDRLSAREGAGN